MSNTRHLPSVPALGAPPSPDVQLAGVADVIGKSTALHLAQMLGQLLPRMPWRPECATCIRAAKARIRAYEVQVANAQRSAEPVPDAPPPADVAQAVTWQAGEPVCFGCYVVDGSDGQPVSAP